MTTDTLRTFQLHEDFATIDFKDCFEVKDMTALPTVSEARLLAVWTVLTTNTGGAESFSSNDEICADNYNYFRFKLKGKGSSEMWEVYLYSDKTIKVDRDSSEVLPRGLPPPSIGGVGFGPSPNLATDHTIHELCLPSERGMGMSMNLADPVSSGKYSGT